ncbi:glycoside hydrolase family 3 protein [Zobellia galactanivorans]|uniref:glycoside hydrolase family 3 protein n=1 Tax=Zobellia galactanivorans (strain DSM 12802 / CCUG 47099 / CIP 106680 / NCIMB 13871 / Dsij) TaxID=63186 RepID=UPI001C075F83|nr:glycoside hydrolase family 3 N-terminal domain-containing protein [Zobellia galactanivorans]MBU3024369.1 glycoside hydrolase family 3 protein [Zobellia galactanivorans]
MSSTLPYIEAKQTLALREKIGQLFMPAAFINDSEIEIQRLETLIKEHCIGSICFFHSRASAATNFEGKKKIIANEKSFETLQELIRRYQKAAKHPLLIAIDAEWGLAMRIENTPQYPYAITLGAIPDDSEALIYEVGKHIAQDCKTAGIHWNLAPCIDINNNPNNPVIGYRSFGQDRDKVTKKALAFIKGTQSEGVLSSIKHFPGHGDTATDSHLGLPVIEKTKETLFANELYPFQKLIAQEIDSVMAGHLSVPALANGSNTPSSLSKDMIKGVLRREMKYDGLVISDALNMHAVSKNYPVKGELEWLAFDAGNDVLCFAEHIQEGIEYILKNADKEQIEASFQRLWKLKERIDFHLPSAPKNLTPPDSLNLKIAEKSLTLLQGSPQTITEFSKTNFTYICNIKDTQDHFLEHLRSEKKPSIIRWKETPPRNENNVLLALFPPQVKPTHGFGFTKEEISYINHLIATQKVVLYLFGNPYVLNLINYKKTKALVLAYQNFEVFQTTAARHFLNQLDAQGSLPVSISS